MGRMETGVKDTEKKMHQDEKAKRNKQRSRRKVSDDD